MTDLAPPADLYARLAGICPDDDLLKFDRRLFRKAYRLAERARLDSHGTVELARRLTNLVAESAVDAFLASPDVADSLATRAEG